MDHLQLSTAVHRRDPKPTGEVPPRDGVREHLVAIAVVVWPVVTVWMMVAL